jgi:hypothetical protein
MEARYRRVYDIQGFVPEVAVHGVPKIDFPQFLNNIIDMSVKAFMSLDHLPHQLQKHLRDIWRIGRIRKGPTVSDNEITEDIK